MIRNFTAKAARRNEAPLSPRHVPGHGAWRDGVHREIPA